MTKEELEKKYNMTLDEFVENYKRYQEKAHYWKKEYNHIIRIKNEEINELQVRINKLKECK